MKYKYGQKLPKDIENKLDAYIERVKAIKWFKPDPSTRREDIEKLVNASLEAFGVKAGIEFRSLKTREDYSAARMDTAWNSAWDAAREAAWDTAWDAARGASLDGAAWDAAREAAWDAAWDVSWGAALDAARGAQDILISDLKGSKGAFLSLVALWEAGMYPCGVIDGKFVVYSPIDFTAKTSEESVVRDVIIDGVKYVPAN